MDETHSKHSSDVAIPPFVCPRCHGNLREEPDIAYRCSSCGGEYPIVLGIPDFRLFPDPWISFEDDRDKARRLEGIVRDLSFADAVRAYWDITPSTPRAFADRFVNHVLRAEAVAEQWLAWQIG